jgi:DNA invertase Pin-like site-specific DNA recombinase
MKAAIYARVSRGDLESENQLRELREFCARKGWEIFAEYVDEDVRGDAPRPQLQALLRAAHETRFEIALFWSLDRMSRAGVKDAIDTLYSLEAAGVEFVSFREAYVNTLGPWRDAVIGLLATLAKMEKVRLSERTKAGLARARAEGRRLGRPRRDYGTLTAADVVQMRAQGHSWAKMEADTGIPAGSLRRLAKMASSERG